MSYQFSTPTRLLPSGWIEGERYDALLPYDHVPDHIRLTGRPKRMQKHAVASLPAGTSWYDEIGEDVKNLFNIKMSASAIAERYGLSKNTIINIRNRLIDEGKLG